MERTPVTGLPLSQTLVRAPGDVVEALIDDTDGQVPAPAVAQIVAQARDDLHGQVPPGAMPEMLHRLARERLRHFDVAS